MHARLILFTLGPGTRATAELLMEQFVPALRARSGFRGMNLLSDDTLGQYGAIVLWASKEEAEAASDALFPRLKEALRGLVEEPPMHPLFEVIEVVEAEPVD